MFDVRKPSFDEVRACPPLYSSSVHPQERPRTPHATMPLSRCRASTSRVNGAIRSFSSESSRSRSLAQSTAQCRGKCLSPTGQAMQAAMPEQRTGQFEQHQEVAGLLFISGTAGHRRASAAMPSAAQERAAPAPSAAVHMAIFDATDPLVLSPLPSVHIEVDKGGRGRFAWK